ncbi:MAG: winged helix DNA-binding protein [Sphingomonadales bacterium]|nr:winged helix DNA-binding protein [Sphingomonadales bacterium]MBD3773795.1 winged helix DNA-binding protein [Paracoccaceae bacterium]
MPQADFAYQPANDAAGIPLSVSIFADRPPLREQLCDDAVAAGFRLGQTGAMGQLVDAAEIHALGDLVLVDCPVAGAAELAALARLDMRAARSGARLVVSTSVDSLDAVFACLDQSAPQILVDPTRGERVIALGRVLATMPGMRLRELSDDDRLSLLRLTEQVGQIAERLERMSARQFGPAGGGRVDDSAFRFESPNQDYRGQGEGRRGEGRQGEGRQGEGGALLRKPRPPLPDARLVRQVIAQRQARARYFDAELFADPAWDILLDLTAARVERKRVSVTSLCIASGVPPTTALRWIAQMSEAGLLERVEDETDRRRAFIQLSDKAADAMARYFAEVGAAA